MGGDGGFGQFLSIIGMGIALLAGPAGWGIYGVLAGMGVATVGGMLSQQAMKRDAEDALRRAREAMAGLRVNSKTQLKAIQVLYGRARVGGNIVYMKTTGQSNRELHTIWGVGEGPIDGFEEVWFGDVKVWDAAKISANSGQLETPYKGWFDFDYRLGTNAQSRFSQVSAFDADFMDTYPMTAMAYLKLIFSQDKYQSVPQVNFVVRGRILNRPWDAGSGWTDSPAIVVYDQMTHPRYGLGVSTTAVNCGSWVSANSYCQEPPPVWNQWIEEQLEQVSFGPRKFTETVPLHSIVDSGDNYLGDAGNIGGGEGVKLPIRPGSVSIHVFVQPDPESGGGGMDVWYKDVPSGTLGVMATTGTIVLSSGSTVGSIDYFSGKFGMMNPYSSPEVSWFGGYGVVYRTKFQYLARSFSMTCGSETLVETGTITTTGYLVSSQGGQGWIDYTNGILEARMGGVDWWNFAAATVRYKISSQSLRRFTYNGGYVDPGPILDQTREVLSHMRGFMVFAGGEYKLKCERPGTSIYSFNDENIVAGSFKVNLASFKDKPNRIRVKYVDALQAYSPKDAIYDVGTPSDIQGFEREQTLVLPGCIYRDQAHRIAQTLANAAALGTSIGFETKADAMALEPGDIVDVTHPACAWVAKLFRIWYVAPSKDEKIEIRAFEHDDSIYADAWPYGDMKSIAPSAYPTRTYFPPDVTSMSAGEIFQTLSDGTIASAIRMKIEAVNGSVLPAEYRFTLQFETASKAPVIVYQGKNPEFTWSPAAPGAYNVSGYTISDYGIQGAVGKSFAVQVVGGSEYTWQRMRYKKSNEVYSNPVSGFPAQSNFAIDGAAENAGFAVRSQTIYLGLNWCTVSPTGASPLCWDNVVFARVTDGAVDSSKVLFTTSYGGMPYGGISLIPSSGDMLQMFFPSSIIGGGSFAKRYSYVTLEPNSMTVINTGWMTTASLGAGVLFERSAVRRDTASGNAVWFYKYMASSSGQYYYRTGFAAMSANLFCVGSPTFISSNFYTGSFTDGGTDADIGATLVGSHWHLNYHTLWCWPGSRVAQLNIFGSKLTYDCASVVWENKEITNVRYTQPASNRIPMNKVVYCPIDDNYGIAAFLIGSSDPGNINKTPWESYGEMYFMFSPNSFGLATTCKYMGAGGVGALFPPRALIYMKNVVHYVHDLPAPYTNSANLVIKRGVPSYLGGSLGAVAVMTWNWG